MISLVFDTETTGLVDNPARRLDLQPEIISFASLVVNLETGEMTKPFYKIFCPSKPVDSTITRITGFTNEHLRKFPSIEESISEIISRIEAAPLVIGQNVDFDKSLVNFECQRYNYSVNWPACIDLVANTIHLKGYRLTLTNLHLELFGTKFESAHTADGDVKATAKCAIEMFRRGWL